MGRLGLFQASGVAPIPPNNRGGLSANRTMSRVLLGGLCQAQRPQPGNLCSFACPVLGLIGRDRFFVRDSCQIGGARSFGGDYCAAPDATVFQARAEL
jgi:hypothetical protein